MIAKLRNSFNTAFANEQYDQLLEKLDARCGTKVEFRVAETPVFLPKAMLDEIAAAGAALTNRLLAWPEYLEGARKSIPEDYRVAGDSAHPHFLTADFALVANPNGDAEEPLVPRLVELQAFPSVYMYQSALNDLYAEIFDLPDDLGVFLGDLDKQGFLDLFRKTVLGTHAPENVVLTEVDPQHQKTLPDFLLTAKELGIAVVDIASLVPIGDKLHYKNATGELVPIHRIYNRAIADEMIARGVKLSFDLTAAWDVEWAGHPNWYFLISKYSVPWLSLPKEDGSDADPVVPPAVFLEDFLNGAGFDRLIQAGIALPTSASPDTPYEELLLKPLFSFAGKGIQFGPTRGELEVIPKSERGNYLLQQKMRFVPTIETPYGLTQAEIRILYLWPDGGELTPILPLVRLGRGKMMGVDHNRNQAWVGASAAFWQE